MHGKGGSKSGGSSDKSSGDSKNSVRTASNSAISNAVESLNGNGQGAEKPKPDRLSGAWSLAGKYSKNVGKAVLETGASATGAMMGFAGGLAQGDISAAFAGAMAGKKAGKGAINMASNGIKTITNIPGKVNEVIDTFNEGAYGAETAQNIKDIREFKSGSAYKALKDAYGDTLTDDKLGAMLKAGINDKSDMAKILESGNTADAIGYYTLAKKCPDNIYYNKEVLKEYVGDLAKQVGLSQHEADTIIENMKKYR